MDEADRQKLKDFIDLYLSVKLFLFCARVLSKCLTSDSNTAE